MFYFLVRTYLKRRYNMVITRALQHGLHNYDRIIAMYLYKLYILILFSLLLFPAGDLALVGYCVLIRKGPENRCQRRGTWARTISCTHTNQVSVQSWHRVKKLYMRKNQQSENKRAGGS